MVFFVRITENQSYLRLVYKSTKFNPKIQRTIYLINFQLLRLHNSDFIRTVVHQYQKLFHKKGKSLIPFRNVQNLLYFLIEALALHQLQVAQQYQQLTDTLNTRQSLLALVRQRDASLTEAATRTELAQRETELEALIAEQPATAAKLMTAIASRLAERLRESGQKLQVYARLVLTLQQEIDVLMPTPGQRR